MKRAMSKSWLDMSRKMPPVCVRDDTRTSVRGATTEIRIIRLFVPLVLRYSAEGGAGSRETMRKVRTPPMAPASICLLTAWKLLSNRRWKPRISFTPAASAACTCKAE